MDFYADPRRLNGLPQEYSTSYLLEEINDIPAKVVMCPQIRFRNESFGALVYKTDPLVIILVNHSAAAFLRTMAGKREEFDFLSFLKQSGAKTESERRSVERLYRKLIRKGFLLTLTEYERR